MNSYRHKADGRTWRMADLLAELHEIRGIDRIKFVTNYPKDMTDDLLVAVRDLDKVSPYLHVPAQSGSNRMLERMKRGYTVEDYREMMSRIRSIVPEATVTSDFIVGFCGETDEDFAETVELVQESRFKNSFIFKYSERPGTKSATLYPDDVPEEVKKRRNNELLAVQDAISEEDSQLLIGRRVEVLVEGPSKTALRHAAHHHDDEHHLDDQEHADHVQLTGRTHCDRIVCSTATAVRLASCLTLRFTMPTRLRCLAAWSPSTSGRKFIGYRAEGF